MRTLPALALPVAAIWAVAAGAQATPAAGAQEPVPQATTGAGVATPSLAQTTVLQPNQVAAIVQTGWARYDHGNKGALTALEFGAWILAAKGMDVSAELDRPGSGMNAKVLNATMGEFVKADTDHNNAISREELAAYLAA